MCTALPYHASHVTRRDHVAIDRENQANGELMAKILVTTTLFPNTLQVFGFSMGHEAISLLGRSRLTFARFHHARGMTLRTAAATDVCRHAAHNRHAKIMGLWEGWGVPA